MDSPILDPLHNPPAQSNSGRDISSPFRDSMPQSAGADTAPGPHTIPFLHSLLTLSEAAVWWRISPRKLIAQTKGRRANIPAIWLNRRVVRFSPLIVLAKAALDAGLPIKEFFAAAVLDAPAWEQALADLSL